MNRDLDRLARFVDAWKAKWPGIFIEPQVSLLNHESLRGYEVFVAYASCLYDALQAEEGGGGIDFDYLLVFEDDAIPFPDTTWPSAAVINNDLDSRLEILEREGGSLLFLGGHHFAGFNATLINKERRAPPHGIVHATYGLGSYAVVIPRREVRTFFRGFAATIANKTGASSAPDLALWEIANAQRAKNDNSGGAYISVPLLVDHAHGFSHTWGKEVEREFEGSARFW